MADEVGKTDWLTTAWTVMAWVGLAGAPLALMGSMASCEEHDAAGMEQWFVGAAALLILGLSAATAARFCRRLRQQN